VVVKVETGEDDVIDECQSSKKCSVEARRAQTLVASKLTEVDPAKGCKRSIVSFISTDQIKYAH